jgi:cytosine/adenosine deaminase-related metal-dependent hydrolase
MGNEHIFEGQAFLGEYLELLPARIVVREGVITAIEELTRAPPQWICPAFFNAHTHVGDTLALDLPVSSRLEDLVTPPDGLKHRILSSASRAVMVEGMRAALIRMLGSGTGGCADFREGGPEGVARLREAARDLPFATTIFGREGGERDAEGLGISSVRDVSDAESLVARARKEGKRIALHAGERDGLDVDQAIAFRPDLLVHATHASRSQLRQCAEEGIPIAVCPRSNWTLGVTGGSSHPPLRQMVELGCTLLLGTDNAMFVSPDMFREMAFLSTIYHLPSPQILKAAVEGAEILSAPWYIARGAPARFFCVDAGQGMLSYSRDPCTTLVKRVNKSDILENVLTARYE